MTLSLALDLTVLGVVRQPVGFQGDAPIQIKARRIWWALLDLNQRPTDYESKCGMCVGSYLLIKNLSSLSVVITL